MNPIAPGNFDSEADEPSSVVFARFTQMATCRYVMPPLILSAAIAVALLASFLTFATTSDGAAAAGAGGLVERFLGNDFSRAIVFVFLTSAIYGGMQLAGAGVDRDRLSLLGTPNAVVRTSWLAADFRADLLPGDPHDIADRYSFQRHRHAELGLLPLRFSVWVLPLLGLIGTVVGIARSLTGLEAVIAPGAGGDSAEGLLVVLGGLQFAFDTTLLGLASAIPVMLLQMVLGGRESAVTEEGHRRVLGLLAASRPPGVRDE